jgi:hypothetical protein
MEIEEEKPLLGSREEMKEDAPMASPIDEKMEDTPNEDSKPKVTEDVEIPIRTRDIGVWRVFYQDKPWSFLPGVDSARRLKEVLAALPFVWRFLKDVWILAPGHLILWGFLSMWEALEGAVSLWVTAQMLQTASIPSLIARMALTPPTRCKTSS